MEKVCDHTSVAMFVWKDGKLLLIERAKPPYGLAVPAGHVDGDHSFEDAAIRELREEVGLEALKLELIGEGRKENPCRRVGGTWHYWKLYKIETKGELKRSLVETKRTLWAGPSDIRTLENELEPVMRMWFKELKII